MKNNEKTKISIFGGIYCVIYQPNAMNNFYTYVYMSAHFFFLRFTMDFLAATTASEKKKHNKKKIKYKIDE